MHPIGGLIKIFNKENTEWRDGYSGLILGQPSALIDSINSKHRKLFKLYKGQKQADWQEDEIDMEQTRIDFLNCPPEIYQCMIKNLSYQWEADSIAANSLIYVLAPFITDTDFKLSVTKNCEIENLHALTYAEIVRLATPDPQEVIRGVMESEFISDRADTILELLEELKELGCKYVLGMVENNQELYNKVFLGLLTFYLLERMQFMASFAHTFAIVEKGWFQGVGKLVQKIMQDEYYYHCRTMEYAITTEMASKRGCVAYLQERDKIVKLIRDVRQREYDWNEYIYSTCGVPGVSKDTMNKQVDYNAQEVYDTLGISLDFKRQDCNPIKFMDDWIDLDKFQNANQEGDNNNYSLNCFVNDVPEGKIFSVY